MATIKVNVMNELLKIRKGVVYESVTATIDELFQNCQRAKATEIEVIFNGDTLTIQDNGTGCKNLETVFEKSSSGWGLEEAFGEGFFSTFSIAETIVVESFDKMVGINVNDMLASGNLSFVVEKGFRQVNGFAVSIKGSKIVEHFEELAEHIISIGEVLPARVTINNNELTKREITALDYEVPFELKVKNKFYEGTLAPAKGSSNVELFYEYRKVNKENKYGLVGKLHLKAKGVTLKAPDRKALVIDDAYHTFRRQLHQDGVKLYKAFIKEATDEQITRYADAIDNFLSVEDYINILGISADMTDTKVNKDEVTYEEPKRNEQQFAASLARAEQYDRTCEDEQKVVQIGIQGSQKKEVKLPKKLSTLAKNSKVVWIEGSEVGDRQNDIALAEYYGYTVIVAKNVLYANSFRHLGIMHLDDFQTAVRKQYNFKKVMVKTNKEKRAMWLLGRIEAKYNIPGTFLIADIDLELQTVVNDKVVAKEKKKVEGVCRGYTIYLDRKSLQLPKMDNSSAYYNWDRVNLEDYKFLLRNADTIAHELAHRLYGTLDNTMEHSQAQAKIAKELIEAFC